MASEYRRDQQDQAGRNDQDVERPFSENTYMNIDAQSLKDELDDYTQEAAEGQQLEE
jgi:hypothetical protein